jgi:hypothetical protein
MSQDNKTDSSTPSGAGGTAAPKTDSTASAKAAARKKQHQQQQKNQKSNPTAAKKKQPQVVKSTFEGIASGVSPMKGTVIAQGDGNLAGQFRVFQKKLAGAAADDKAYGLDSSILDLIAKKKSDFVMPKPDPLVHSHLVDVLDEDKKKTGERKLICHNPVLRDQMEAEYSMDLKIQKSNWNQFERHYEGYYRIAIGNIDDTILTYCREDKRMVTIESNKDLVGLLLVLRAVCAQNNGAVKVDKEYQNLGTLHSAVGFRQKKTVNDIKYADEVADRYGSAIFTSGKFTFGLAVYEIVLKTCGNSPMTLLDYLKLPPDDQVPIDALVKERTVARLIVKNSLNERLREHLRTSFTTNNDECYPNTISDALSLLSTFAKQVTKDTVIEDAVVSYHETADELDVLEEDDKVEINDIDINAMEGDDNVNISDTNDGNAPHVTFNDTVMAAIIAEATADADDELFFGANFEQLQEVEDAYEKDEPDIVCCAHVVDNNNDVDDEADFISNANNSAEENNDRIRRRGANITPHPDPVKDFELSIYHTAQRVLLNSTTNVYVFNYEQDRPDLISHTYDSPVPESVVDYSDALRFKLKSAGIHDITRLMSIFSGMNDSAAMGYIKEELNEAGMKG